MYVSSRAQLCHDQSDELSVLTVCASHVIPDGRRPFGADGVNVVADAGRVLGLLLAHLPRGSLTLGITGVINTQSDTLEETSFPS